MSQGTIVTMVVDTTSTIGLEAAIDTARRLSMHLEVICLAPASFHLPPQTMADAFIPMIVAEGHAAELIEQEKAVKARLEREDVAWSVSAIPASTDALGYQLAQCLRFADLALVPRTGPHAAEHMRLFETMLYTSRVPILLADAGLKSLEHVLLAWDESDVSLAAIRAAAPILAVAETVEVVMVDLPDAGEDLARMLSRRGVSPVLTALPRGDHSIAESLLNHAKSTGAEIIVSGAYGHARLREMIIGGVTRDLLRQTELPLLLAR